MSERNSLDDCGWRIFRLFLASLEDPELHQVGRQLHRELNTRLECETHWARLFFSSLPVADLETAHRTIRAERLARVEDRRKIRRGLRPG